MTTTNYANAANATTAATAANSANAANAAAPKWRVMTRRACACAVRGTSKAGLQPGILANMTRRERAEWLVAKGDTHRDTLSAECWEVDDAERGFRRALEMARKSEVGMWEANRSAIGKFFYDKTWERQDDTLNRALSIWGPGKEERNDWLRFSDEFKGHPAFTATEYMAFRLKKRGRPSVAQMFWRLVRRRFRLRNILFYWQEQAQRALFAPGGAGREADRAAFESEFA